MKIKRLWRAITGIGNGGAIHKCPKCAEIIYGKYTWDGWWRCSNCNHPVLVDGGHFWDDSDFVTDEAKNQYFKDWPLTKQRNRCKTLEAKRMP